MKKLFTITALVESVTGLILLISPSFLTVILLGKSLDEAPGLVLGRIAGTALLSIGTACWLSRKDEKSTATKGIGVALLLYNFVVAFLLVYVGINSGSLLISLWVVVLVHLVLAIWLIKIFVDGSRAKTK